jgi:hypothetical protein
MSHLRELKLRFPTYTQQLITQTFELIRSLLNSLSTDFFEEYLSSTNSKSSSKSIFGEATIFHPILLHINDRAPWSDRLSYDIAYQEQEKINNDEANNDFFPTIIIPPSSSPSIYTKKWLEDHLRTVLKSRMDKGDLGQQEFCNLVFENLASSQTDDEIQHSLCDIIGYDYIELIIELIQNRRLIIDGVLNSAKARPREIVRAPELSQRLLQPVHGPTIVVQTLEEKRLEKQIRKQDRKQYQQHAQQSDEFLDEFSNPELLKYERERQLLLATTRRYDQLSNTTQSNSSRVNVKYPFVFDQLQDIKQKTAYIGGRNLLLPENIERKTAPTYDLVHIPHGEQIKLAALGTHICPKLITFEDLEPLGQILFKDSITTLNLVQSVVYKTAAFSNENILISAPYVFNLGS